jgi:mannose-6-phosphate isomerase
MRLHAQYENDVGVFCVYLLNYLVLKPGEALFLGANEPHAYISGDCAEIMATSDNVVRAGLTPKWKDVDTLVKMLTYTDGAPHHVTPTQPDGEQHVWRYSPPVDEFALERVQMREGEQATLSSLRGLAILLVVKGSVLVEQIVEQRGDATPDSSNLQSYLTAGAIHLLCPNTALRITVQHDNTLLFRACAREVE